MKNFLLCLLISQTAKVFAENRVAYSSRSSILDAKAINHDLPEMSEDFMRAHLWATAFFLEMYPERDIYFLGRDAEQMYDVALFLVRDVPAQKSRLHLINVSRGHRNDAHLKDYLRQHGLHSPLRKKVLFVDTGNTDKIINSILGELDPSDQSKIVAHYLNSSVSWIPSLRMFASWHDRPKEGSANPEFFNYPKLFAQGYEGDLLHATETSNRYELINGVWEAVSSPLKTGHRSKLGQENWAHWLSQSSIKDEARELRLDFKAIHDESRHANLQAVRERLKEFQHKYPRQLAEAVLYDYFETRLKNKNWSGYLGAKDFGLTQDLLSRENDLLRLSDSQVVEQLRSANGSAFYKAVSFFAFDRGQRFEAEFIDLLKRCGPDAQEFAAEFVFSRPGSVPLRTSLRWLIENGSPRVLKKFAEEAFSRPHARAWIPEASLLMQKAISLQATTELPTKMVDYVFRTRNVIEFKEALEYGLRHGISHFAYKALQIWDMPWASRLGELHQLAIEKANSNEDQLNDEVKAARKSESQSLISSGLMQVRQWCVKALSRDKK